MLFDNYVWDRLSRRERVRLLRGLDAHPPVPREFTLPGRPLGEAADIARSRLLLKGFAESALIVAGCVIQRRPDALLRVKLLLVRHPPHVPLPIWRSTISAAVEISFGSGCRRQGREQR